MVAIEVRYVMVGKEYDNRKVRVTYTAVLSKKAVFAFFAQNELLPPGDCVRHYLTVCKARKP